MTLDRPSSAKVPKKCRFIVSTRLPNRQTKDIPESQKSFGKSHFTEGRCKKTKLFFALFSKFCGNAQREQLGRIFTIKFTLFLLENLLGSARNTQKMTAASFGKYGEKCENFRIWILPRIRIMLISSTCERC